MNILEIFQRVATIMQRLDTLDTKIERERAERQQSEATTTARFERLEMQLSNLRESFIAVSQRLGTAMAEIEREHTERQRFEDAVTGQLKSLEGQMADVKERLIRLETSREADRERMDARQERMDAKFERFQTEVEQVVRRLAQPFQPTPGEPPALSVPENETDSSPQ
jgi:chromosome segregation ATPase